MFFRHFFFYLAFIPALFFPSSLHFLSLFTSPTLFFWAQLVPLSLAQIMSVSHGNCSSFHILHSKLLIVQHFHLILVTYFFLPNNQTSKHLDCTIYRLIYSATSYLKSEKYFKYKLALLLCFKLPSSRIGQSIIDWLTGTVIWPDSQHARVVKICHILSSFNLPRQPN